MDHVGHGIPYHYPAPPLRQEPQEKQVITNLSGENLGSDVAYRGAGGRIVPVQLRNWYLESWFGEKKMTLWGYTACLACVLMELSLAAGGMFHV